MPARAEKMQVLPNDLQSYCILKGVLGILYAWENECITDMHYEYKIFGTVDT